MALPIFESRKLIATANNIKPATTFITDTFFKKVDVNSAENIDVEIRDGKRKLAPFVSPLIEGKLEPSLGKQVTSYKPAYIKFKYATEAEQVARETNGVFYADGKSPAQRAAEKAAIELKEGIDNIKRRIELMATEAVTTGNVTIKGDGIDEVIDFGMKATHQKTLTGTALWTDASSDPLKDLRAWKREVAKDSGYTPSVAVMGSDVIDAFLANDAVQKYLDNRRINLGGIAPSDIGEGVTYYGEVEGLKIYSYDGYYEVDGTIYDVFPSDKILLGSDRALAKLNYGAIKDFKAGNFVGAVFVKSWEVEDPSARFVLLQSAPLPVPVDINAFMCNKVV